MKPLKFAFTVTLAAVAVFATSTTAMAASKKTAPAAAPVQTAAASTVKLDVQTSQPASAAQTTLEDKKKLLDDSVAAGVLTREEADAILKVLEDSQTTAASTTAKAAAPAATPAVQAPAAAPAPQAAPSQFACIYGGYCYGNGHGVCDGSGTACYNNYAAGCAAYNGSYYGHHSESRGHHGGRHH